MEEKKFKKGDIIVSGRGNVGVYLNQISEDGFFYRLTARAKREGTDPEYARFATEKEKKRFIEEAKKNLYMFQYEKKKLLFEAIGEKKRVRPSLADYKELQKECECLMKDLSSERARIRMLEKDAVTKTEYDKVVEECERQRAETKALAASYDYLDKRLKTLTSDIKEKKSIIEHLRADIQLLCNRGLFARIFNKYSAECINNVKTNK